MKTMKTVLSIIAAGSIIMTGCHKDESVVLNPDRQATNNPGGTNVSPITYELVTVNDPQPIAGTSFNWISGYGSETQISFEARSKNADVTYKSNADQRFDLFSPSSVLGNISIPPGTYDKVKFRLKLKPNGSDAALQINGQLNMNGTIIPVVFVINNEIDLLVEGKDVVVIDGDNFITALTMQLSMLMNGITADMIRSAAIVNGRIVISVSSNSGIYRIMLNNINYFMKVEFKKKKK